MKADRNKTVTVAFRLGERHHQLLCEAAKARGDQSAGEYARELVRDALVDQHSQAMLDGLQALTQRVDELRMRPAADLKEEVEALKAAVSSLHDWLREKLGDVTVALLNAAGKVEHEAAREYVRHLLN